MRPFQDKTAVITGAGSGLGRALALQLNRAGAQLALCDLNMGGLDETRTLLSNQSMKVTLHNPGFRLIRAAIEHEIPVIPIPGPSAVIAALRVSGLPTDAFLFKGFLPHKSKKRKDLLKELEDARETLIFYESPHRISETLKDVYEVLGDREIVLSRELTKLRRGLKRKSD